MKEYTYDKAYLDASFSAIDINHISEKLTNVSTRVDALEDANFIDSTKLDASLKDYAYSKNYIDASVNALDVSIKNLDASSFTFDASIKIFDASIKAHDASIVNLDASVVSSDNKINDVSSRMPIFEYDSTTQTLNIIA